MAEKLLEAQIRSTDAVVLIELRGMITSLTADVLTHAYEAAKSQAPRAVLLHLDAVEYINSGGIGHLLCLLAQERAAGRCLLACGLTDFYVQLLRLTCQVDGMGLFSDEASALAELGLAEDSVDWETVNVSTDALAVQELSPDPPAETLTPPRNAAQPRQPLRCLEGLLAWSLSFVQRHAPDVARAPRSPDYITGMLARNDSIKPKQRRSEHDRTAAYGVGIAKVHAGRDARRGPGLAAACAGGADSRLLGAGAAGRAGADVGDAAAVRGASEGARVRVDTQRRAAAGAARRGRGWQDDAEAFAGTEPGRAVDGCSDRTVTIP